ncbi:hypothetical protein PR202_gb29067 [Eleusine coracana subsp. coracana]|uniref:Zinc finger PHD-type domain-containing protein n=1 Tax=Eleusine coracana subsp. coracana TaxID=191504 RepID=A0AAV5FW26_ELECO|nr:hypothetical protein PR202_gb29067 [Eleusine coracana subsp. coracana]
MCKKHVKAENVSAELSGEKRDLSLSLAHYKMNDTRAEGLAESKGCSEIKYSVTESCAKKIVTTKRQQSRTPKKSSVRGSSKDLVTVPNGSNTVAESCQTDFKAHADSSLPKSSSNLFLQSGKSLTLCQLEAWTAEYMYRQSNNEWTRKVEVEAIDEHDDTCGICGDGGELLCCDNCPSTYHQACLSAKELPDDGWPFDISLLIQCSLADHDTCIEMTANNFEDTDFGEWFCGRNCKEIYLGLHGCVGMGNSLGDGLSWTILRSKYARLDYQGFYTVILEKGEEILCAASIR